MALQDGKIGNIERDEEIMYQKGRAWIEINKENI